MGLQTNRNIINSKILQKPPNILYKEAIMISLQIERFLNAVFLGILLAVVETIAINLLINLTLDPHDNLVISYFIAQILIIYYALNKLNISPLEDIVEKWF